VQAQNSVNYFRRQRSNCDLLSIDAVRNCPSFRPDEKVDPTGPCAGINYKRERTKLFLTFAIIAVGLGGRSALDKILALRGGAEFVALWAQLSSLMEMVAAVALSGVGAGLSVLVAQTPLRERQQLFLRRALVLGLAVSLPVAAAAGLAGWRFAQILPPQSVALAALAGWIAVIHGLVNSFWLGQQRRGLMLALAFAGSAISLGAAAFAPQDLVMELIVVSQAVPAVVLLGVPHRSRAPQRADDHALERYILPGVAIGILSPLSMLVVRSLVADALSWHESGVLQALWRMSDWICGFAAGVLSVLYLPRMAAAYPRPGLAPVLRESMKSVLLPSALLFLLLFAFHRPVLEALYDPSFEVSPLVVALLFAGSLVRVAAWIPLFGLYAALRTRAIAIGELLSLPLFAALAFALGDRLTLEALGALWLATYLAYAVFNFWACARR
jgi:PST family polysaccharide transporter